MAASAQRIILFDGLCGFCNAWVRFAIRRDPAGRFSYAMLQSRVARELLARHAPGAALPDSVVLIDDDGLHTRSEAAIRIACGLEFPWSWCVVMRVLPRSWRDGLYDIVARNRYRWFGKGETCMVPTGDVRSRFLDADEPRA